MTGEPPVELATELLVLLKQGWPGACAIMAIVIVYMFKQIIDGWKAQVAMAREYATLAAKATTVMENVIQIVKEGQQRQEARRRS